MFFALLLARARREFLSRGGTISYDDLIREKLLTPEEMKELTDKGYVQMDEAQLNATWIEGGKKE